MLKVIEQTEHGRYRSTSLFAFQMNKLQKPTFSQLLIVLFLSVSIYVAQIFISLLLVHLFLRSSSSILQGECVSNVLHHLKQAFVWILEV